jgi:DNA-binding transcriptional LysR family regulator
MILLDLRQLKYFLAIGKEGNLTKASKKLHIAQPPLSYQLKLLEEELGVKLVERTTRKVKLTDAGNFLFNRGEQIIEFVETTEKELKDFNEGIEGTLSIGTTASASSILYEKTTNFHKIYPKINFQIRERNNSAILELLSNGIIQIGIINAYYDSNNLLHKFFDLKNFEFKHLYDEPMVAAYADNFTSSFLEETIPLSSLNNLPLVLHLKLKNIITDACSALDFTPTVFCESDDVRSMLTWADTGMGVAIVPKSAIILASNKNLLYKEITNPNLITKTFIVWMNNHYITSAVKHFLEMFEE